MTTSGPWAGAPGADEVLGRLYQQVTGADISDLDEEHGHRVLRVHCGSYVPIVPTEAINSRLEHLRGSALGFRNLTHCIARSLLEAGGFRLRLHPAGRRWYFHRHGSEGKEGKGAEPRRVW